MSVPDTVRAPVHVALADLRLSRLFVVHAGRDRYAFGERTEAVPLAELARALRSARPA